MLYTSFTPTLLELKATSESDSLAISASSPHAVTGYIASINVIVSIQDNSRFFILYSPSSPLTI